MLFGAPSIRLIERRRRENKGAPTMTELINELGPVGWLVVEFPGSRFNNETPLTISACLVWQTDGRPVKPRLFAAPAASCRQRSHSGQALPASLEANPRNGA
jgi:hypothetical protein